MKKTIENKFFESTLQVENEYKSLVSYQEDFALCEADYLRIKNRNSKVFNASLTFFLTTAGYLISILAKLYDIYIVGNKSIDLKTWEITTVVLGFLVSLVLYIIGKFLPNDYRKVMNDIKTHFQNEPRKRIVAEVINE